MATRYDWKALGFASQPDYRVAPNEGVVLYRCWGATSTEIGNGFFSMERPVSVYDAELKFNIADWGNGIHWVSTFKLQSGFAYLVGSVAHRPGEPQRPAQQVWVEPPVQGKVLLLKPRELLRHDVVVLQGGKFETTTH